MIQRRGFLTGLLALGAAPAIVRASSLMPVRPPTWLPGGVVERPFADVPRVLAFDETGRRLATIELPQFRAGLAIGGGTRLYTGQGKGVIENTGVVHHWRVVKPASFQLDVPAHAIRLDTGGYVTAGTELHIFDLTTNEHA